MALSFSEAAGLIERGIASRAFPAATIEAGRGGGVLWRQAFGTLTYGAESPAASNETVFDLASLTKVIATTPLVMQAIEAGRLALENRVADLLPAWRGSDREAVTIADLLEHASGLTAYLPFFRDHHGRAEFERAICTLPLEYAPRAQSIYSDLGFILLAFILEDVNRAPFAKQFDRFRFGSGAEDQELLFNPPKWMRERCAPTELDLWRGRLLQGEVHDENTWVLGGAAGHAGLFGTTGSVGHFARQILKSWNPDAGSRGLEARSWKPETLARFLRKSDVPGSSRALGWDTMLTTSSCGNRLSPRAIGHTGFTGTSLWIDPAQDLYVVFLTNRVHPTRDNNQIQAVRRAVHDAVARSVEVRS